MSPQSQRPALPLRVLACSDNYPSPGAPHEGIFVHALLRQWTARGIPVSVLTSRPWRGRAGDEAELPSRIGAGTAAEGSTGPEVPTAEPRLFRARHLSFSNLRIGPWSSRRLGQWSFDRAIGSLARRAVASGPAPTLAYAHFLFQGGHALLPIARRLGIPAVVALGESSLERYLGEFGDTAVRRTLGDFDGVLAVSETNRDWALAHGAAADRIEVIANAADLDRFRPLDRARCRAERGLPADAPIVAFVGRLSERKGPLRLLEALRGIPDARVFFLGEGSEIPRGPQVLHVGPVPPDEIPGWLGAADCFALPSRAEGSPNVVAEALACGLPVVASPLPGVRALVDEHCATLVPADDVQALRSALAALLADPEALRERGRAARRRAEAQGLAQRADRVLAFLTRVQEGAAGSRP